MLYNKWANGTLFYPARHEEMLPFTCLLQRQVVYRQLERHSMHHPDGAGNR